MLKKIYSSFILLSGLVNVGALAQSASLQNQIAKIAKDAKATVGVSVLNIENRKAISFQGELHLPMQSVMKFPIAITMLHQIDEGKFKLEQLIHVREKDLSKFFNSQVRDEYLKSDGNFPISKLLSYMVSLSDNAACDILLKVVGGPKQVEDYMHLLGVKNIAVKASEFQMSQAWQVQFTNWCEPLAMSKLLAIAYQPNFLSKESHTFLWKILEETSTGPKQIKGLLPLGTVVAHKTGRSSTNEQGITAATNDVGIINLPNGKHLAIAVFISNSPTDLAMRESIIARIAKAAYDDALN